MLSLPIPYEKQMGPWTCGAAALAMAYRWFGLEDTQTEIWNRIGTGSLLEPTYIHTRQLAVDALERGLHALVLQVQGEWLAVRQALEIGACCIVNHRLAKDQTTGHFSVVTGLEDFHVSLNDPFVGSRRLTCDELLKLWGAGMASLSVPGLVMVVIADAKSPIAACSLCQTGTPASELPCDHCGRQVPLEPGTVLGCMRRGCPMRSWDRLFCPWCDRKIG